MSLVSEIIANPIFLLIPLISGFVGWFTNWVAVKMMLYPVERRLGWQGLIPANASELARGLSKVITEKMLTVEDLVGDLRENARGDLGTQIENITNDVIDEFSTTIAPSQWARANDDLKAYIRSMIEDGVREVMDNILDDFSEHAKDIVDIEKVMVDVMDRDCGIFVRVLNDSVAPEFKFIESSGLWFGLLFGVIQLVIWVLYPSQWILPAAGFFVGYATNWLAMNLIFEPAHPIKVGPFVIQGAFLKRQQEVAENFSRVMSDNVLSADHVIDSISTGKPAERIKAIVERRALATLEEQESDPMLAMIVSAERLAEAKDDMLRRVRAVNLQEGTLLKDTIGKNFSVREMMHDKMSSIDSTEFGNLIRPAFQADEWKLIVTGGVLGVIFGVLQVVFLFGDYLA